MGNILASLPNLLMEPQKPCNFILLGLDASGKTTLLYRWTLGKVVTAVPMIGVNTEQGSLVDGTAVQAWDVGGRDKLRMVMSEHYYPAADALIYCVDPNDPDRMNQASDELHRILQSKDVHGKPLLIFCNKQDLPGALPIEDIDHRLRVGDGIKMQRPCRVLPCVATSGQGVNFGLQWLSNAVTKKNHHPERIVTPETERNATATDTVLEDHVNSLNKTLEDFRPIQQGTQCPFAKAAKLWGGCDGLYDSPSTADKNAAVLTEFVRRSTSTGEALDGFCVALPGDGGPEILGRRVRSVLTGLSDRDPAKGNMMRKAYIGQRGWRFRFSGAGFFVTTFSPCYPSTSSRFSFGTSSAFVLLQPDVSFYRHKLPPDSPVTADPPKTIRDRTRLAFRDAGRSYHIPGTIHYPPAEHMVKPLRDDGKTIVRWWTHNATE